MKILITGGAGFIGSTLVKYIINKTDNDVINLDKLTYAGNLRSLETISDNKRYSFEKIDIKDFDELLGAFNKYKPDCVMHLAAESHVDRSISGPEGFIQTNIVGTYILLEVVKKYFYDLTKTKRSHFKFHHISTDEVYGDIGFSGNPSKENDRYKPSSPYSASKASSDHLVRSWSRTYKLPFIITNSSNNYGPYHFPEKLIPLTIKNALEGKDIPVYGKGDQIRDWLYVEDHATALYKVLKEGTLGETYNIGGNNEKRNIDVVIQICELLDEMEPASRNRGTKSYKDLITHTEDRPGHDLRYALDITKIKEELDWQPSETFKSGLVKTIEWNLLNREWSEDVLTGTSLKEESKNKLENS
tara:strand:+ start:2997 stop:4073 length:1077 start_codon:yes stop_codon:yes gene_type:complete